MIVTIGCIVVDELAAKTLSTLLRGERLKIKERVVAASRAHPFRAAVRIVIVVGYLASLLAVAFFVQFSPWAFLIFTLGWSALTVVDAPHVVSRPSSLFYEVSLLLNGIILALCFDSSVSDKFASVFTG